MNLKDLSQIDINDLKNIDVKKIVDVVKSRPDILIIAALIILTLILVIHNFSSNKIKSKKLKKSIKQAEEKLKVTDLNRSLHSQYNDFVDQFPDTLTDDQMINKLADFALAHDVRIQTFSPANERNYNNWVLTSIKLKISSQNYQNTVAFIKSIETAPYAIRIEKWSGGLGAGKRDRRNAAALSKDSTYANIEIGSLRLKND